MCTNLHTYIYVKNKDQGCVAHAYQGREQVHKLATYRKIWHVLDGAGEFRRTLKPSDVVVVVGITDPVAWYVGNFVLRWWGTHAPCKRVDGHHVSKADRTH